MNLEWKKSEVTGNLEASFNGKLLSVSETVLNLNNDAKTEYRIATIQIDGSKGSKNVTAIMYESNFKHGVEKGNSYLCKAVYDESRADKSVLITISHLVAGDRATIEDFGIPKVESKKVVNEFTNASHEFASAKK